MLEVDHLGCYRVLAQTDALSELSLLFLVRSVVC